MEVKKIIKMKDIFKTGQEIMEVKKNNIDGYL